MTRTTIGLIEAASAQVPAQDALVGPDGRITYGTLEPLVARLAGRYAALGLRPGDRIGVLLPNGTRLAVATLAGHYAGLAVVPVNTWYRATELAYVAEKARLSLIVTDEQVFGRSIPADLDAAGYTGLRLLWPAGEELPGEDAPPLRAPRCAPEDIALILFTSGSTANPKPVPLIHDSFVRNTWEIGARQHARPGDRIWFAAPFFFGYGCSNAWGVALNFGAALCLEERTTPDSLAFIEAERCSIYYGLATSTRALLAAPGFGTRDISSLRTGTTGFTADDKRLTIEELGVSEVCSVYGLTEAYGHSVMTDAHDPLEVKLHTQGTVLPTQQLRVIDEQGRPCPPGVVGEVQLRGTVIERYLDSPEHDAPAFTPDGWFRTGDLADVDEAGRMRFVGRMKEMLKVKGINIAPAEVEEIVCAHDAVDQVFVFGVEAAGGDEAMACAVVPRAPVPDEAVFTSELVRHVRAHAASYKVPSRFIVLSNEQLPTTDTGKVSKRLLREMVGDAG
jgi:fatty-acyl-CoA synthase